MGDWMDRAVENQDTVERYNMDKARLEASKPLAAGEPGECEQCGEDSPRLVDGLCARCRDANEFRRTGRRKP